MAGTSAAYSSRTAGRGIGCGVCRLSFARRCAINSDTREQAQAAFREAWEQTQLHKQTRSPSIHHQNY
jgi:hypothetical protein